VRTILDGVIENLYHHLHCRFIYTEQYVREERIGKRINLSERAKISKTGSWSDIDQQGILFMIVA
jgi:hypothetical protein